MHPGGVLLSEIRYVPPAAAQLISNYRIRSSDIFISVAGTLGIIGRVPHSLDNANLTENADRITELLCDVDYLMYSLMSDRIQNEIGAIRTVGAQPKLALGRIKRFLVPLPISQAEQRAIAEALRDSDRLIETLKLSAAKKRAIKQGMMQQLLTGKTRLAGFAGEWSESPLTEVSSIKGRIGWQGLKQDEFTSDASEPFLITGMNFKDGAIAWSDVYHVPQERYDIAPEIQLRPDDVLMTKDGTIGKLLYVDAIPSPGMATLNSHLLLFRPKHGAYIPRFLYYQLASPRFLAHIERHKSGSTFYGMSQNAVAEYSVLLPSLEEQEAIADALAAIDSEILVIERRLEKHRQLKQGMMQELLTGRTRLIKREGSS